MGATIKLNTETVPSDSTLRLSGGSVNKISSVGNLTINDLYEMILELQGYVPSPEGETQYRLFVDDSITYRIGVRGNSWVKDRTLNATGFSGTENIDWENIEMISI